MNREIKFRAYIKTLKWTVPVSRINFDCETVEVDLTDGNGDYAEYDFDEIVLMQFAGLKDKNGVEIYEGDIIKDVETEELFKIIYEAYSFLRLNKSGFFLGFDLSCDDYKVIGNIHDNPELMEVQENNA